MPRVQTGLQLVHRTIRLLAPGHAVKLIFDLPSEPRANPVGLETICLGLGMIHVLDRQVKLGGAGLDLAAIVRRHIKWDIRLA